MEPVMASIKTTIKVDGLKELGEALQDFSKATGGNILKRAISVAGAMIAEEAVKLAPKKSGALKRGIKVGKAQIISAGKSAYAAVKAEGGSNAEAAAAARQANKEAGGTGRQAVVQVGPVKSLRAAVPQEFGTYKMHAKPYMRPAWDANDSRAVGVIRDALEEEIDKATARAQKKAARLLSKM
jgi:HK97 gp10 family phage protein